MLMVGSPGSGKSMPARRRATILPPLTAAESLDTTRIIDLHVEVPFADPAAPAAGTTSGGGSAATA